jgi:lipoprotein-anchoring transpeptidase ErfK/SrfK
VSFRTSRSRLAVAAVAALAVSLTLAGCQKDASNQAGGSDGSGAGNLTPGDASTTPAATLHLNVSSGAQDVKVSTALQVRATGGTVDSVVFKPKHHKADAIPGAYNADKSTWTATELLEPATTYVVKAQASSSDGTVSSTRSHFTTEALTLDQQTYPSVTPLQGQTVGVGMPVIVQFDIPVHRKAAFEKHMTVTSQPAQVGSWNWISDNEAHWRPKRFWQPHTQVHVHVDVNGVNAGHGIYGQMSRDVSFTIGDSVVMHASLKSDHMRVKINGKVARNIPITGGKPGFETRSGIKLIIEKFEIKRMDASTIGIEPGDPNYYNIPDVHYAQRVTFSGEFLHAAPWSVYAQGSYNVSHGCVGMSMDNGAWLYSVTHIGDPVIVTGTNKTLEPGNGWTDWNESFKDYKQGSALS